MATRLALGFLQLALVLAVLWALTTAALDAVADAALSAQTELDTAAVPGNPSAGIVPPS